MWKIRVPDSVIYWKIQQSRNLDCCIFQYITESGDNQLLKAVTGGIPTVHFGFKTSGIRGAELLLDVIERGENIPMEIKLGFRLAEIDDPEENIEE